MRRSFHTVAAAGFVTLATRALAADGVELDLRLPDGRQPVFATVDWRDAPGGPRRFALRASLTWTPDAPVVDLPAGSIEVRATEAVDADGDPEREYASDFVAVGDRGGVLTLELTARRGIRGTVSTGSGAPLHGAAILYLALDAAVKPDRTALAERGAEATLTGADFAILDVAAGRYTVGVALGLGAPVVVERAVEVGDGITSVDFEVPFGPAEDVVTLRMVDDQGELQQALQPGAQAAWRCFLAGTSWPSEWRPDGTIGLVPTRAASLISASRESGASAALSLLVASPAGVATVGFQFETGRRSFDVVAARPGPLRVRVNGALPAADKVLVALVPEGKLGMMLDAKGALPLVNGQAELVGPCVASFDLAVFAVRDEAVRVYARTRVQLERTPSNFDVTVPPLQRLELILRQQVSRLELYSLERGSFAPKIEGSSAVFEDVPPGEYLLEARGAGAMALERVTLPAAGPLAYSPAPVDCLLVHVLDPNGRLARAGLREGDRILGIGGEPFIDAGDILARLDGAAEPQLLAVRRGAAEVEVSCALPDARSLADLDRLGGALERASTSPGLTPAK